MMMKRMLMAILLVVAAPLIGAPVQAVFPEVGVRLWRLEGVADMRLGDRRWLALRLGWTF